MKDNNFKKTEDDFVESEKNRKERKSNADMSKWDKKKCF